MPQRIKKFIETPRTRAPDNRGSACERGYNARWQRERKVFLQLNPLCVYCKGEGRVAAAECIDHIVPHKGDMKLFWDQTNWAASCIMHNSRKAAREEGGYGNVRK